MATRVDPRTVERVAFRALWVLTFPLAYLGYEFYRRGAGGWQG